MIRSLLNRLRGSDGRDDASSSDSADSTNDDEVADQWTDLEAQSQGVDEEASTSDAESDAPGDGSNSVWDLIPSWEYDGKYVQSGGHSRGEQERALQDIQRQAAQIERSNEADEAGQNRR